MKQVLLTLLRLADKSKCATLTLILVGFLLFNAVMVGNLFWDNLLCVAFYFSMIFAPWFINPRKKFLVVTLILGAAFLGVLLVIATSADPPLEFRRLVQASTPGMTAVILVECLLTGFVIFYSLAPHTDSHEPVWGCILAYLLAAVVFADLYWICKEHFSPGFAINGVVFHPGMDDLIYFSLTTLTTCGYGDITPVHPLIRQLAGFESVFGVLYVALFIGRQLNSRRAD